MPISTLPQQQSGARIFALWPDGAKRWEVFDGLTSAQASGQARAAGARVLQVESAATPATPRAAAATSGVRTFSRKFDLLLFSQELLSLLGAGLNLVEAVETLNAKAQPGVEQSVLQQMVASLHRGEKFSQVLEQQSTVFPSVYVESVRASERTSNLPQALERFIAYQQQFDVLRRKVVTASIYPFMLMVVGSIVVLFLLGFVVPRFAAVYESSGRDLPWLSSAMLIVGRYIHGHAMEVTLALFATIGPAIVLARRPGTASALTSLLLHLPGIGQRARLFKLARFFRVLSLLLSAGVPLARAINMVSGLLGHERATASSRLCQHIEQGLSLSAALERETLISPVARSLLKVGERSGSLPVMLEKAAAFHDEELSRWIESVSRLLEPLLMLAIGLVIGTVVVLMYIPIFDLASSFR